MIASLKQIQMRVQDLILVLKKCKMLHAVKKVMQSNYKVQQQEGASSGSETEPTVYAMADSNPKPWNPPSGLKFHCSMADYKHEVSTCAEFLALSPLDRW